MEFNTFNEALAGSDVVGSAVSHVNVSVGGVNLDFVRSDGRATVSNLVPRDFSTALVVLVSSCHSWS